MQELMPFANFEAAARGTLELLRARLRFDLWMITRTEGDDWIVLHAVDHGYGVQHGNVLRWADSFCSRMVRELGPRIAPRSSEVPAYATAGIGKQLPIGAYIGVPLKRDDGSLFGTLCAIHPTAQPDTISAELPLVEALSQLLSSILATELRADEHARRADRALAESLSDPLTGLYNRRGWDRLLTAEESRCRRFGHAACILSIDLDGLKIINDTEGHHKGDELLVRAAQTIQATLRSNDFVARIGGDEFVALGVECSLAGAAVLTDRVRKALTAAGIEASVGFAVRDARANLSAACQLADHAMYAAKKERRTSRSLRLSRASSTSA